MDAGIIDKNKLDLNVYYLEMVQVRTKIDSSNIASYIILRVEVHVNFDHIKSYSHSKEGNEGLIDNSYYKLAIKIENMCIWQQSITTN